MARSNVATQKITRAGLNPNLTAVTADGDVIDAGNVVLQVRNDGTAACAVTIVSAATVDGLPVEDLVVSVPAGQTREYGPFPARTFQQPPAAAVGAGRVLVNYAPIASVFRAVKAL